MKTEGICPSCGRLLAAGAPQELCAECLMKAGFGTGVAPEPGESTSQPPSTSLPKRRGWEGAVAALLCATAFIFWLQRPRLLEDAYLSKSPDGRYSALAHTFRAMRIFGGERWYYRFTVQGPAGAPSKRWDVPIPTAMLTTNSLAMSLDDLVFNSYNGGRIQWSEDGQRVLFSVRGIAVLAFNVTTRSTERLPVHWLESSANRSGRHHPLRGCLGNALHCRSRREEAGIFSETGRYAISQSLLTSASTLSKQTLRTSPSGCHERGRATVVAT